MTVRRGSTEGQMAMQKMLEEKSLANKRSRRTWRWSTLITVLFCLASIVFTGWAVFVIVGFVAFIGLLLGLTSPPKPHISMEEYKSLPGAIDARLAHACLQCGHHGIHRRTVYGTSTTLAECSACQASLWSS